MPNPSLNRRIQAALQLPDIADESDAIRVLRASLRVSSDCLEDIFLDGPPPKGRSADDRDAYLSWLDRVVQANSQARAALDATDALSDSATGEWCARPDSNGRPRASEARALIQLSYGDK